MRGAGATMVSVMPVRTVISGGMAAPGLTSVWNVPRHSPPRTFTAPISVMPHDAAVAPVVSRSTTQNVASMSGVPRSSNERCTAARYRRTRVRVKHMFVVGCQRRRDAGHRYHAAMAVRYRCASCGNLTRFDVVTTRRTRAFHHYTTGGDLSIEDEEVLEESVEPSRAGGADPPERWNRSPAAR